MTWTNGSEPSWQSAHLSVNELALAFSLPVSALIPALGNQGIQAAPHDRLPFQLVHDALAREGYQPERLWKLKTGR